MEPDTPVVVASQNPDKIAEMEEVLGDLGIVIVRGHVWPEVAETESVNQLQRRRRRRERFSPKELEDLGVDRINLGLPSVAEPEAFAKLEKMAKIVTS